MFDFCFCFDRLSYLILKTLFSFSFVCEHLVNQPHSSGGGGQGMDLPPWFAFIL
jgi:hypothetical protein